jgi:phospholipase D1/2
MVEGAVVQAAHRHLHGFLAVVACQDAPPPAAPGFLRTLSCARPRNLLRMAPRLVVTEIEAAHLARVGRSRHLVYLETQFLRHVPLARALARRARACPDLCLMVVLPAAPESAAFSSDPGADTRYGEYLQWRCLRILRKAFGRDRLLVAAPVQPRRRESEGRDTLEHAPLVYVHAKVSIFDGAAAIVSSANLNGLSMRWDTEAGIELTAPDQVAALENRVMGHWYGDDAADLQGMTEAQRFAAWQARIAANTAAAPEDRKGFLVEYDSAPAREAALMLPGVPAELV